MTDVTTTPQAPVPPDRHAKEIAREAEGSEARRAQEDDDVLAGVLAKHGLAAPKKPAAPTRTTEAPTQQATTTTDTADATADDSPADPSSALTLSNEDAGMLRRLGLEPEDLPDDPTRRDAALARHRKAFERLANLATENGRLRKAVPGQQPPASTPATRTAQPAAAAANGQTATAAQAADPWAMVDEVLADFGPDVTPRLRGAIETVVQTAIASVPQPDTAAQEQLWRRLEREDFDRGVNAATFPDGVHKTDAKVRGQLLEETKRQYHAEILRRQQTGEPPPPIEEWNYEHAAQRAVSVVFAKQLADQAKRAADERRRKQVSGLPDAGTRAPTTKAAVDPDEADLELARSMLKKHGVPVGAA